MKAIQVERFGGPEVMRVQEVPDPQAGAGQVVVRVRSAGVNPVDTYIRAGMYGEMKFPYAPGADCAGEVEQIGDGVSHVRVGQRVYAAGTISGAYAEKALCDARRVHPLPVNVSFEQGAALGVPYGTAHRALFGRAGAKTGETVLVHGASGGVGIAAVQLAHHAKMRVIGTAGTEAGRKLVLDNGAEAALDHSQPGYLDKLMELTGGRGVDVVLEMLANVNLDNDLKVLAKFGRVVVIGSRGRVEIDPRETMKRDADIRGMILFNATEDELTEIHADIVKGLEEGWLRPVVGRQFSLEQAPQAHVEIIEGKAHGKIVLAP